MNNLLKILLSLTYLLFAVVAFTIFFANNGIHRIGLKNFAVITIIFLSAIITMLIIFKFKK